MKPKAKLKAKLKAKPKAKTKTQPVALTLKPDPANPNRMADADSARRAELTIETVPLARLKPHPENPRRHPDPGTPEWEALRKSLEHDYFDPIVWNRRNGMLVSGHLRVKVLAASGFDRADCVVVDYDDALHKIRMIAANRLIGEDDDASLRDLLEALDDDSWDMDLTGYVEADRERLMTQFHVDRPEGDAAGSSPWDRVGDAADGVMFSFGTIQRRVPTELFEAFSQSVGADNLEAWLREAISH